VQEHNELMGFSKSLGRRRTIARWGNRSWFVVLPSIRTLAIYQTAMLFIY
jgi:hypothetical protein